MALSFKKEENSISTINSENSLDELREQNIYEWLDKNGIFMDSPNSKVSTRIRSHKVSPIKLSSDLFQRRIISHNEKKNKF